MNEYIGISALLGKTLVDVTRVGDEEIRFTTTDGDVYSMFHSQDCCECVTIDDIEGDLQSLVGNPILVAEEASNRDSRATEVEYDSWTWTFYKLATINGHVDIRWFGSSNGYYSEEVSVCKVTP